MQQSGRAAPRRVRLEQFVGLCVAGAGVGVRVALLVVLVALSAQPLHAQGYWPFGYGPPPYVPRGYPNARPTPPPQTYPSFRGYPWAPFGRPAPPFQPEWRDDGAQPFVQSGTYRTLCVRLCDGYYFPISNAASGTRLGHDADMCQASCGVEARLFYYPNAGGDVESMVDLTGMAYSALPNAFKYRKTLVESCRCRPQPWSQAERQRHQSYAQGTAVATGTRAILDSSKAADKPSQGPPGYEVIAGGLTPEERASLQQFDPTPGLPADAQRPVARPQPIARRAPPGPSGWDGPGFGQPPRSKTDWPVDDRVRP
jgi:hypothetical protein